jgi:hypothetical protein
MLRFDSVKIGKMTRTSEGFLSSPNVPVAQVGVLTYMKMDGSIVREYVPAETLFNADSIATLRLKPVTVEHQGGKIDVKNAKAYQVGATGDMVARQDSLLTTSLVVTSKEGVDAIEKGATELSCCYDAAYAETPGIFNGQAYDRIQIKRIYNHLTFTKLARGGKELSVCFDSLSCDDGFEVKEDCGAYQFGNVFAEGYNAHQYDTKRTDGGSSSSPYNKGTPRESVWKQGYATSKVHHDNRMDSLTNNKPEECMKVKHTINSIEYEGDAEIVNALKTAETKVDSLTSELEKTKGERDSVKTQFDSVNADIPGKIAEGIKVRSALLNKAVKVLAKETKFDTMSDKDIKVAIIKARLPKIDVTGKSDEYIQACFDSAWSNFTERKIPEQRFQSTPVQDMSTTMDSGDGEDTSETARQNMIKRNQEASASK